MPWWASLRTRIGAGVALVTVTVLLGTGAVVDTLAAQDARERLRAQTLDRLDLAAASYAETGSLRFGASTHADLPTGLAAAATAGRQASLFDGETMYAAQRLDDATVLSVAVPGAEIASQRSALRVAWARTGLLGAVIATGLGWLVGTWLSRRLRDGARAAAAIASGSSTTRAFQPGRDEVALLTRGVDDMAAALHRRLEVEREFTADVAHELRSPVTGLVSAVELLPQDAVGTIVRSQSARLRRLVEDLLEISRLESGQAEVDWGVVHLEAAVRSVVEQVERERLGLPGGTRPPVTIQVERPEAAWGEDRRVERILGNLIRNALDHGGTDVSVSIEGTSVTVQDRGPGFPEHIVTAGPRRFSAHGHGSGSGLGLTIAVRQAEVMGAQLTLTNVPQHEGGGARAVLALRAAPHATD